MLQQKLEENKIYSLKLLNGDEVVAKLVKDDMMQYVISKPLACVFSPQGLGLTQWMITAAVVEEEDYVVPGTTPEPKPASEYCHKMRNPETGLMVEVENPEEHEAAIAAGYTEDVKED